MNKLKVFDNTEFGNIRAITVDGVPWLVGKDVAEALGYTNPKKAISDHVEVEDKAMGERNVTPSGEQNSQLLIIDELGRKQYPVFINESGLYSLILSSKLPKAKTFKRWVTSEVLPSLRQTGSYSMPDISANIETELTIRIIKEIVPDMVIAVAKGILPHLVAEAAKTAKTAHDIQQAKPGTSQPTQQHTPQAPTPKLTPLNTISITLLPQPTKVETFPPELRQMVDELLLRMKEAENMNFSQVARLCTMHGCSISSPAIKRYYDKHFVDIQAESE